MSDRTICLLLAVLTTVLLLSHLPLLWFGIGGLSTLQLGPLLALIYFGFGVASIAGLVQQKLWGFVSYYGLAFLGTFAFSLSLLPFVVSFFPGDMQSIAVLLINAFILSVAVTTHITLRRERSKQAQA